MKFRVSGPAMDDGKRRSIEWEYIMIAVRPLWLRSSPSSSSLFFFFLPLRNFRLAALG